MPISGTPPQRKKIKAQPQLLTGGGTWLTKPITEIPAMDFMIVDQRLWDLCRHQQWELRTAGLITDEE